jgi:hypothetical protein
MPVKTGRQKKTPRWVDAYNTRHRTHVRAKTPPPPSPPVPGRLDRGIAAAVERLQASGIETFQSCEGGPGHARAEPTISFHGTPEAGWRAVAICIAYRLPIRSLCRVWDVLDTNEPTGPHWEITFRERISSTL